MVQEGRSCCLLISCMLFIVLTVAHSQEDERRAVAEHQLMHDRGRSIQSLRRLIWLSSAIERLHTAEPRSLPSSLSSFTKYDDEGNEEDAFRYHPVMDSGVHQGALALRDMHRAPRRINPTHCTDSSKH
ncbi:parathyroid hormone 4 [Neoarius graeffei]|uniref:parathyroid hormone 4 n=1 Tax=Neoarius graeffei TaxID=443677 RepID=UPI00298D4FCC|nr:parathyroid hormone 4 [Neoarius graeffei]